MMMPTSLRRRGQVLVPLDPLEEEAEEGETGSLLGFGDPSDPDTNIFDHYVSPCEFRVSNDPLLVSDHDVCDATIYGCVRDHTFLIRADDNVRQVQINFEYDMYYRFDSRAHDFNDMLEFLEGAMLEHLASLLGLKQCPPVHVSTGTSLQQREPDDNDEDNDNNNNRRRLAAFTDEQKAAFIAINSDPVDVKSTSYECLEAPEEGTGIRCQTMEGSMTLYLEEARVSLEEQEFLDKVADIQESVLRAVQAGMETDVYAKAAIEKLVYIDDRSTDAPVVVPAITEVEEQPTQIEGGLDGTQIGLIAGASSLGFLIFLLACCFLAKRRRVESESDNDEPDLPKEPLPDEDEANGRCSMMVGGGSRRSSQSNKVAPSYSLEGAERPGSLAAMDALALRPQRQEGVELAIDYGEQDNDDVTMPPAISRVVRSSSSSLGSGSKRSPQGSLEGHETRKDLTSRLALPTVPLSPVSNPHRGMSPSQVSPKRQPRPFDAPIENTVENDEEDDNDDVDAYSSSAAIEVQTRGSGLVDSAIRTLRKIVSSDSEVNNHSNGKPVSFDVDDTSSFDSRSRRR